MTSCRRVAPRTAKSEEEIKAAFKELRASRVGRMARLTGQVETLVAETPRVPASERVTIVEAPPEPPKPGSGEPLE